MVESRPHLIFHHCVHPQPSVSHPNKYQIRRKKTPTHRDECEELDSAMEAVNNRLAGDFPTPRSSRSSTCFTRGVTVLVRFLIGLFVHSPSSPSPSRSLLDDATVDVDVDVDVEA